MEREEEKYNGGDICEEVEMIRKLQEKNIQKEALGNSLTIGCTQILTIVCC